MDIFYSRWWTLSLLSKRRIQNVEVIGVNNSFCLTASAFGKFLIYGVSETIRAAPRSSTHLSQQGGEWCFGKPLSCSID
eukprot:scaffold517_cov140-Skeletonema_marinoi.AAC.7